MEVVTRGVEVAHSFFFKHWPRKVKVAYDGVDGVL